MSTIDERVVSMKFDNAQFESGTKTTMKSLADLQKSLSFDGAKKGMGELQGALNSVRVDGLTNQVSGLTSQFEGLRAVATGALLAIGAKIASLAVSTAQNLGRNMFQGALDGLSEYELQINSVQTILSNTARYGTTIEDVNGLLAELNEYADKTIYNFASMTQNIGTFTVAGVKLEDATAAIKGFSNMAALAGANSQAASGAMYQLSQAMSSGVVRLQDWMSIEKAGIAGVEFQDALKITARAHGVAVDDMIEKNGSFRNSLSENWLTADIMTQTLAATTGDLNEQQLIGMGYTAEQAKHMSDLAARALDSATKVKTLTQVFETYSEAVGSGWAQSWQLVFGDFEQASALFTEISDIMNGFASSTADARNEQLKFWADQGGRTALIDGLRNVFDGLMAIITPIGEAWNEVFPPSLGKTLLALSIAFRDFTAGLKMGADGSAVLKDVATVAFKGLKIGVDLVGAAFKSFFSVLGTVFDLLGAIGGFITPIITFLFSLTGGVSSAESKVGSFADKLIELKDMALTPVITFLREAGAAFNEFLNGDPSKFGNAFQNALKPIIAIGEKIKQVWGAVAGWFQSTFAPVIDYVSDAFSRIGNTVGDVRSGMKPLSQAIGDFFSGFGEAFAQVFEDIDFETVLSVINTGILATLSGMIFKVFHSLGKIFDGAGDIMGALGEGLEGLTGVLEGMQSKLKAQALLAIAGAIALLAAGIAILAMVEPERLISAVTGMASAMLILMGAMYTMSKITSEKGLGKMIVIAAALIVFAGALNIFALALTKMGSLSWEELAKGILGVLAAVGLLLIASEVLSTQEKSFYKSAAALVAFSAAVLLLAGAVTAFGLLPMPVLIQGFIALAAVIGLMVGSAVLLSKFAPEMYKAALGLMAMAAAINMLIVPLTILGLLPIPVLIQGFIALGVLIGGLVTAAILLDKASGSMLKASVGLMAMGVAVNLVMGPLLILGAIPWPMLLQGLLGLAGAMAILVVAANSMKTAVAGAGAMMVMALAVTAIAVAVSILGNMDLMSMIQGLAGLAAAFIIMGVASAVLAPLAPAMITIAGAIALLGLGVVAVAASTAIFALGLMLLGPALVIATAGLLVFAEAAGTIVAAVPAMLALGAGLLIFGAGAAVAGLGVIVLGAGLLVLGAGLLLVGAVGLAGATILTAVVLAMAKLIEYVPGMLALGAGFLVLGAGVALFGAGLLLVGVGALAFVTALALLSTVAAVAIPALTALVTAILALIPVALEQFGLGLQAFAEVIIAAVPTFVEAAVTLILGILQGIQQVAPEVAATLMVLIDTLLAFLVEAIPKFVTAGIQIITGVLNGIAQELPSMITAAADVIIAFLEGMGREAPRIIDAGFQMVIDVMDGLAKSIRENSTKISNSAADIAEALIDGIVDGVSNFAGRLWSKITSFGDDIVSNVKNALGINSPSKRMIPMGKGIVEGVAVGVDKNTNIAYKSARKMSEGVVKTVGKSLKSISDAVATDLDMTPTIRPVLDMTAFKKDVNSLNGMINAPKLKVDSPYSIASNMVTQERDIELARTDSLEDDRESNVTYNQYNSSPKALSEAEIYRQTKNQISTVKNKSKGVPVI